MNLSKSNKEGDSKNIRCRQKATVGIIVIAMFVCCFVGVNIYKSSILISSENNAYAETTTENSVDTAVNDSSSNSGSVNDVADKEKPIASAVLQPYQKMGYKTYSDYVKDMKKKHKSAKTMYKKDVKKYKNVITKSQKNKLKKYRDQMIKSTSPKQYNKALKKFKKVEKAVKKEYKCTGGVGRYTGGSFKIPYNFRSAGVLHDSKFGYTYYSSRVLYHYMTPKWILCKDGIYRDSKGRVIVASDDYKHGTVLHSDLFGTCIVRDCGVGRSGVLDVYVSW